MAAKVGVFGQNFEIVGDILPNQQQNWIVFGAAAQNGVVAWVSIHPFPGSEFHPGEKILTVTDWSYEATDDGGRRIFLSVTNTGHNIIEAYLVSVAWTDIIP